MNKTLLLLAFVLILPVMVSAELTVSTDYRQGSVATSNSSNGGVVAWTNPERALEGPVSNVAVSNPLSSAGHNVSDKNVTLVRDNIITGSDYAIAATTANWTSAVSSSYYGGSSDLWGLTFTRDQIRNDSFGVAIAAQNESGRSSHLLMVKDFNFDDVPYGASIDGVGLRVKKFKLSTSTQASIDAIELNVTYTFNATPELGFVGWNDSTVLTTESLAGYCNLTLRESNLNWTVEYKVFQNDSLFSSGVINYTNFTNNTQVNVVNITSGLAGGGVVILSCRGNSSIGKTGEWFNSTPAFVKGSYKDIPNYLSCSNFNVTNVWTSNITNGSIRFELNQSNFNFSGMSSTGDGLRAYRGDCANLVEGLFFALKDGDSLKGFNWTSGGSLNKSFVYVRVPEKLLPQDNVTISFVGVSSSVPFVMDNPTETFYVYDDFNDWDSFTANRWKENSTCATDTALIDNGHARLTGCPTVRAQMLYYKSLPAELTPLKIYANSRISGSSEQAYIFWYSSFEQNSTTSYLPNGQGGGFGPAAVSTTRVDLYNWSLKGQQPINNLTTAASTTTSDNTYVAAWDPYNNNYNVSQNGNNVVFEELTGTWFIQFMNVILIDREANNGGSGDAYYNWTFISTDEKAYSVVNYATQEPTSAFLNITWLSPTVNSDHQNNTFIGYVLNVTCLYGSCGDTAVYLDPEMLR